MTDIYAFMQDGWTALGCAVYNGYADIAKMLLENGAAMDFVTQDGWTALGCAVFNGYANIAKMLLENGAAMDFEENVRRTA